MARNPGQLTPLAPRPWISLRFIRAATGDDGVGVPGKTGYACAALTEDSSLTPDNDPSPAPFGGFAPNAAQAAIIALAQRSRLKRGAFRPMLSRLVNLLRAGPVDVTLSGGVVPLLSSGQRHRTRRAVQSRLQYRGARFSAGAYAIRRRVRRCRRQCRHLCAGAGASCRRRRQGHRDRAASRHPCTAQIQLRQHPAIAQVKLIAAAAGPSDGELMIATDGDNLGASHIVSGAASGRAIKVPSLRLQRILARGRRQPGSTR